MAFKYEEMEHISGKIKRNDKVVAYVDTGEGRKQTFCTVTGINRVTPQVQYLGLDGHVYKVNVEPRHVWRLGSGIYKLAIEE